MATVGIIAEFNPLHSGHEYLINEAKGFGQVVCVISGNFVQRGTPAVIDKYERAKMALLAPKRIFISLFLNFFHVSISYFK